MCYIHGTKHYRMTGWVGPDAGKLQPCVYANADFAGDADTLRSTTGGHLVLRGPHASFPLNPISKRQSCVSHSTPEAEIVTAGLALRMLAVPALALWAAISLP